MLSIMQRTVCLTQAAICTPSCFGTTITQPRQHAFPAVCALQGFERTGLGERIANKLLTVCGTNSLGLAIGLAAAEVLVCPAMPSTTSRAAGIFMPVITSVSKAAGSYPGGHSAACYGLAV